MNIPQDAPLNVSPDAPAPWLKGKKIVVTGATGFVGRHLLPQLLAAGAQVTCVVRASSRCDHLPLGVAVVRADLCGGAGLQEALCGQDICIHMAALLFGLGWQDYLRANSRAARALATAWQALEARGKAPQRLVLVSSLAASGPCDTATGRTDDAPGAPVSAYGWSKLMVEQILGRALGEATGAEVDRAGRCGRPSSTVPATAACCPSSGACATAWPSRPACAAASRSRPSTAATWPAPSSAAAVPRPGASTTSMTAAATTWPTSTAPRPGPWAGRPASCVCPSASWA